MSTGLAVRRILTPGLVGCWAPTVGRQLWARQKRCRKPHRCIECREWIPPNKPAWHPVGNQQNRHERVCGGCMDRLIAQPVAPSPHQVAQ